MHVSSEWHDLQGWPDLDIGHEALTDAPRGSTVLTDINGAYGIVAFLVGQEEIEASIGPRCGHIGTPNDARRPEY
ncbi:hypothetical protein GGTG_03482 [Gaeumannomyces tritici R3-111a-1]|uniref:Uncharacterized protein n=1 Tax=Gaeumannomyces tritici (strain R3-111a-1) TaxID=644352 RepID=J3NQC5_GAET3|nr:hypothetical protein GGTG_03482 [Gaeumannomyces tritici R3-111a-1]EJT78381.1 hypothetical protein GGTG_03482 [Gaeumannomyces tritici R3-111a-1]